MQVILNIENPKDWTALLPIIERLGISILTTIPIPKENKHLTVSAELYTRNVSDFDWINGLTVVNPV